MRAILLARTKSPLSEDEALLWPAGRRRRAPRRAPPAQGVWDADAPVAGTAHDSDGRLHWVVCAGMLKCVKCVSVHALRASLGATL